MLYVFEYAFKVCLCVRAFHVFARICMHVNISCVFQVYVFHICATCVSCMSVRVYTGHAP